MNDRADIIEAKARLPMRALLDRLAPDWKKKNPLRENDRTNSFGASDLGWMDHGTGDKGDQVTFLERLESLSPADAIVRFKEEAGIDAEKIHRTPAPAPPPQKAEKRRITVETPFAIAYPYHDAEGNHVYDVRRFSFPEGKDFRPFNVSTRTLSLDGVKRVPYRLPEVQKAETVWIVEGEKDADSLAFLGHVATCRAGGSSTWEPELDQSARKSFHDNRWTHRGPLKRGPVQLVADRRTVEDLIKRAQAICGFAKAGWAACARQLGGTRGIQSWVYQQNAPGHVADNTAAEKPTLTLVNDVDYIEIALNRSGFADATRRRCPSLHG